MAGKTIICVDDEKIILDSLRNQLIRHFGKEYEYEFAESAEEALEILQDLREEGTEVMAIVSDWLMPGMRGDELIMEINKTSPEIHKVMLTGQADRQSIDRAKNEGGVLHVLSKPWNEKELIEAIENGFKGK